MGNLSVKYLLLKEKIFLKTQVISRFSFATHWQKYDLIINQGNQGKSISPSLTRSLGK